MPQSEKPITSNELLQRQLDALSMRISLLEQQLTRLREQPLQGRTETR